MKHPLTGKAVTGGKESVFRLVPRVQHQSASQQTPGIQTERTPETIFG